MIKKLTDREFRKFADLIYNKAGIFLAPHKKTLLESRTNKILRKRQIPSFEEYYNIILKNESGNELTDFINLVSTNTTFFFREEKHFEFIKKIIVPEYFANNNSPISLWCAAASTGEEPYSIAITFSELVEYNRFNLLATDIDTNVLTKAANGVYNKESANVPKPLLKKYFQKGVGKNEGFVRIKPFIKKNITFSQLNLIKPFEFKSQFDIIFCRNVFIYFDNKTKEDIVSRMYKFVKPGGYLLIGHSESLNALKQPFKYKLPAIYQKI